MTNDIPRTGIYSELYDLYESNPTFCKRAQAPGGTTIVMNLYMPVLRICVRNNGQTLYNDSDSLRNDWLYYIPGKQYARMRKTCR